MGGYIKQETASHTHTHTNIDSHPHDPAKHTPQQLGNTTPSPSPPPMKRETSGISSPTAPSRPTCLSLQCTLPAIQGARERNSNCGRPGKRENKRASHRVPSPTSAGSNQTTPSPLFPTTLPPGQAIPAIQPNPGVSTTTSSHCSHPPAPPLSKASKTPPQSPTCRT